MDKNFEIFKLQFRKSLPSELITMLFLKDEECKKLRESIQVLADVISGYLSHPCEDCRFYHKCNKNGLCRTRANFEANQAIRKFAPKNMTGRKDKHEN